MEIARSDHTRRWALLALPLSGMSGCLSQHEVFENEISIAGRQWSIAGTTFDFLNGRFRSGFCFDDLIDGIAVRAKVQWLVGRHKCPPDRLVYLWGHGSAAVREAAFCWLCARRTPWPTAAGRIPVFDELVRRRLTASEGA
jgi:hypothetical protein